MHIADLRPRRPSATLALLGFAILLALSGTAEAATGGTFLLGQSNTASTPTSLTNSKGTALRLTSPTGTPALSVNNRVQVPNLNASLLGGIPATGYVQGNGTAKGARLTITDQSGVTLITGPATHLSAYCSSGAAQTAIFGDGVTTGQTEVSWNRDFYDFEDNLVTSGWAVTGNSQGLAMATVQVNSPGSISTYTVSQWVDSAKACHFTAQLVVTNG